VARYTQAVCRLCRRENKKLHLKGTRCNSPKCAFSKKAYPPGQHGGGGGMRRRNKVSTYGVQLRAKQEAKRTYGLLERQFRKYFKIADKSDGITGTVLLQQLERRLDNIVYRLGFASSRASARLLITHGHVRVNDRKLDIPSYQMCMGQSVSVSAKTLENQNVAAALDYADTVGRLEWLEWSPEAKRGVLLRIPDRNQIPTDISEQLIVELYSK
jgi:small subunit ribosomal protein S4